MKNLRVTVQKPFIDRRTGLKRKPGETMTISEERYREIKRSGDFVKVTEEPAEKVKTAKNK